MELSDVPDTPLLVATIIFIAGMAMHIFPPNKINGIYGYRTPRSMSSKQRWDFAQNYSANRLIEGAVILALAALCFGFLSIEAASANLAGIILIAIVLISLLVRTEIAIKKQFPNP